MSRRKFLKWLSVVPAAAVAVGLWATRNATAVSPKSEEDRLQSELDAAWERYWEDWRTFNLKHGFLSPGHYDDLIAKARTTD